MSLNCQKKEKFIGPEYLVLLLILWKFQLTLCLLWC